MEVSPAANPSTHTLNASNPKLNEHRCFSKLIHHQPHSLVKVRYFINSSKQLCHIIIRE